MPNRGGEKLKNVLALCLAVFLLVVPVYAVETDGLPAGVSSLEENSFPPGEDVPGSDVDLSGGLTVYADNVVLAEVPGTYAVATSPVAGGPYMDVSSSIGDLKIYVPADYQRGSFSFFDGNNVCGIRSSTISGYAFKGSTLYQVRFPAFSDPQYRIYDSGYSYADFSITGVRSTNIQILSSDDDLPLYPDAAQVQLLIFLFLGGVLVCQFMKRF